MKKKTYTVDVVRTRITIVPIDIEATSFEEAEALALEGAKVGRYEIDFNECDGNNEDEYELGDTWCEDEDDDELTDEEKYPKSDWQYDVKNGDTKLGYKEWVAHNKECEESE
jgi:hypothetical protein